MARYVKLSAVAPAPYPLDPQQELEAGVDEMIAHWDAMLDKVLCDRPDLVVLPEACDRPPNFPMELRKKYYQVRGDRIRDHFSKVAQQSGTTIAYGAARLLPDGTYRNSIQFLNPKGGIDGIYNKNYLVIAEYTDGGILYGKEAPLIETSFGKVAGAICFDLNFNELRVQYERLQPELIVFSSMYHGGLVQNYWAYACRSWFIGSVAGNQCTIINPMGDLVAQSTNYYPFVTATVNLDYQVLHIDHNNPKFDAAKRKYGSKIKIYDPGRVGAVMLTSETDEFSARDVVKEFDMELWDDYYARSLAARDLPGRLEP